MKPLHTITVDIPVDPGMMWMRHISNEIMNERIKAARNELKDLDSRGYSFRINTENHMIIGYKIDFYDQSTLNAYMIMKE